MNINLSINGLMVEAKYKDKEVSDIHIPLLKQISDLKKIPCGRRKIIFLSAPPGTGKSTLTAFWEFLSHQDKTLPDIQALPMDGFHHYNKWLELHNLRQFKGMPDTFNVHKLAENLEIIKSRDGTWPQYDRKLHDPVEDSISVTAPVVIVEGNWLLLDDMRWRSLASFCDLSVFIHAPADTLRDRLIARKCAGGLNVDEAEAFYLQTDGPNVERVLNESRAADITLCMNSSGEYFLP